MSNIYLIVAAFFVSQSVRREAAAASSAPFACPNSEICTCTPEVIECICTNGDEDIHFRKLQDSAPDLRSVTVQNCRNVYINESRVFTQSYHLERFRFSDLQSLHFGMFSLDRSRKTASLKEVIIENVKNLVIGNGAMNSFQLMNLFKVSNSHIEQLDRGVISISHTSRIILSDCTIGTISTNSLIIVKAEEFQMVRTTVNTIESRAIVVRDTNDSLFHSNHFGRLDGEQTFSIYRAKSVTFDNCTFDAMSTKAFHSINDVKEFFFQNNVVKHFQSGTFYALGVSDRIVFANNRIFEADDDSLLPNKYLPTANNYFHPKTTALEVRDNLFVCDQRLKWLWEEPANYYKSLLETSQCFRPKDVNGKILNSLSVDDLKEPVNETAVVPPEELRKDDPAPTESHGKSTVEEEVEEPADLANSLKATVVGCLVSILISSYVFIAK